MPTQQQEERLAQINMILQQIDNQINALQQEAMALQQEEGAIREAISKGRGGLLDSQGPGLLPGIGPSGPGGDGGGYPGGGGSGYPTGKYSTTGGFITTELRGGGPGGPGLLGPAPLGGPSYPSRDRGDGRDFRGGFPSPSFPPSSLSPGPPPPRGGRRPRGNRGDERGTRGK